MLCLSITGGTYRGQYRQRGFPLRQASQPKVPFLPHIDYLQKQLSTVGQNWQRGFPLAAGVAAAAAVIHGVVAVVAAAAEQQDQDDPPAIVVVAAAIAKGRATVIEAAAAAAVVVAADEEQDDDPPAVVVAKAVAHMFCLLILYDPDGSIPPPSATI